MNSILINISIIIPIYNTDLFLKKCINSILNQTYSNFELLLINDGSTDNSGVICDEYAKKDGRVKVFHKKNGGVSSARNYGLKRISGAWVTFIDSDDEISPNYLIDWYNLSIINPSDVYFYSHKISTDFSVKKYTSKSYLTKLINFEVPASLWLGIYNAELFRNPNLLLNEKIHFYEDFEFMYRILNKAKNVVFVNRNYYTYNKRDGSANHMEINEKVLSCLNICDYLSKDSIIDKKEANAIKIRFLMQTIFYLLKSKKPSISIVKKLQNEVRSNAYLIFTSIHAISFYSILVFLASTISLKTTHLLTSSHYIRHLEKHSDSYVEITPEEH